MVCFPQVISKSGLGTTPKLRLHDEVPVGGLKMSTFCQRLYHKKCQRRWSKKNPKSCQRSL